MMAAKINQNVREDRQPLRMLAEEQVADGKADEALAKSLHEVQVIAEITPDKEGAQDALLKGICAFCKR